MCSGSALRQEYRRCLEREFHRGNAGPCTDPSLGERLRQRLRREPELLAALQEDGPAMVTRGLRDHPHPELALQGLAGAFQLLELAAVNLYLFPWRKELGTVQTFSGAYVHSLRPALPEADLLASFARLGYEQRRGPLLTLSRRLPAPELAAAACGFFACRVECEILAEELGSPPPGRPRPDELLRRRRHEAGDGGADLYRETPDGAEGAELRRDPGDRDGCGEGESGREMLPSPGTPNTDAASSRLLPEPELRGAVGSPRVPGEARDAPLAAPQDAPELLCYQLHSCLGRGALPSYCCTTCQQLHAGACAAGRLCRSRHRGQELRSERQQRLWLRRTQVDMLLAEGTGPRS